MHGLCEQLRCNRNALDIGEELDDVRIREVLALRHRGCHVHTAFDDCGQNMAENGRVMP